MSTRAELKSRAKEQLKGNIGIVFLCALVIFAISLGVNLALFWAPSIASIADFLITPAFILSITMIFLALTRGIRPRVADVFKGFGMFGKALLLQLLMTFFLFMWSLIALIPMAIMLTQFFSYSFDMIIHNGAFTEELYLLQDMMYIRQLLAIILVTSLAMIPMYIKYFSYSMSYYVLAENPCINAIGSLNESKRIMKGHKMRLFVLYLSFIWWWLLGIVTCGIAFIYVIPYVEMTVANFYLDIRQKPEEEQLEAAETEAEVEPV